MLGDSCCIALLSVFLRGANLVRMRFSTAKLRRLSSDVPPELRILSCPIGLFQSSEIETIRPLRVMVTLRPSGKSATRRSFPPTLESLFWRFESIFSRSRSLPEPTDFDARTAKRIWLRMFAGRAAKSELTLPSPGFPVSSPLSRLVRMEYAPPCPPNLNPTRSYVVIKGEADGAGIMPL